MQVLESPNDEDHADGNVESRGIDASEEAIGEESNVVSVFHVHHMVKHKKRISLRLHTRGLEQGCANSTI
jgi:hypothetical protein